MLPLPPQFPKLCTMCGASISSDEWAGLHLVGDLEDEFEKVELRNHHCGTTLGVLVAWYKKDEQ